MYNVEYERYLQEVVQLLESDDGKKIFFSKIKTTLEI